MDDLREESSGNDAGNPMAPNADHDGPMLGGSITTGVAGQPAGNSSSSGGSRTRRSGLLTVMERPPGRQCNAQKAMQFTVHTFIVTVSSSLCATITRFGVTLKNLYNMYANQQSHPVCRILHGHAISCFDDNIVFIRHSNRTHNSNISP